MMRQILGTIFLLAAALPLSGAANRGQAEHLVLISVDGFNPSWYQDDCWPAPFLQAKAREGAYAKRARPPFPSVTRPGHVTLITGWLPVRHGVFDNDSPYKIAEGSSLWHAVRDAGGISASVVWPGSVLAPVDHLVSKLHFPDFSAVSAVAPDDLHLRAKENEQGHSKKYERFVTGMLRDAQMMAYGAALIQKHRPTLTTLRFNETDKMQHMFGRDGAAVRGVVAAMDMGIAEIAAAVERAGIADRTVIIVTGDHGMETIHTLLRPNVWLAETGLVDKVSARFKAQGGAAILRGASAREAARVASALETLPKQIRDGFTILRRDELDALEVHTGAALALTAKAGFAFDDRARGPAVESASSGSHGHLAGPDAPGVYTGFVAWGAGIGENVVLEEIRLEDVAPTAAALLGLDFGERDGESLLRALRGE